MGSDDSTYAKASADEGRGDGAIEELGDRAIGRWGQKSDRARGRESERAKANSCKVLASLCAGTNLAGVVKKRENSTYAKTSADEGRGDGAIGRWGDRARGR